MTSAAVIATLALAGVSHAGGFDELAVLNFGAGPASIAGLCLNCNIAVFKAGGLRNQAPIVNITGTAEGGGIFTLSGATAISTSTTGALYVSSGILSAVEAYAPNADGAAGPVVFIPASATVPISLPEGIGFIGSGGGALDGAFYVAQFTGGPAGVPAADIGSVILFPADAGTSLNPVGTPIGVLDNVAVCTAIKSPTNTELFLPVGVATDSKGNVYVANAGDAAVPVPSYVTEYAVGVTGCPSPINFIGAGTLGSANGVAVDGTGNIWVSDLGLNTIWEFSPAGKVITEIAGKTTQLVSPMGIALSPVQLLAGVDDLYVANSARGSVLLFEDVSDAGLINIKPFQALRGKKTKLTIPIGVAPL
ncbi:MAG TPA: hypothetical protein VJX23_05570 [Candidatus Binataceae bacterium]|nr:hypothetical protein [Candidatus Binataceae bacterium]